MSENRKVLLGFPNYILHHTKIKYLGLTKSNLAELTDFTVSLRELKKMIFDSKNIKAEIT